MLEARQWIQPAQSEGNCLESASMIRDCRGPIFSDGGGCPCGQLAWRIKLDLILPDTMSHMADTHLHWSC